MSNRSKLLAELDVPETKESLVSNLLEKPHKERIKPKTIVSAPNILHQMDLLYMRPDRVSEGDLKYILVVIDVATRAMDCRALTSHSSTAVRDAAESIYTSGIYLTKPQKIMTDPGTEFKGAFNKWCVDNGIGHVVSSIAGRSRSLGYVEWANKVIGEVLLRIMRNQEYLYGEEVSWWSDNLQRLTEAFNRLYVREPIQVDPFDPPKIPKGGEELIPIGTKVRVMLYKPRGFTHGERLNGLFRNGDQRWEDDQTTIIGVDMRPDQPIMYRVEKYQHGPSLTKDQLQVVPEDEKEPSEEIFGTRYTPERIFAMGTNAAGETVYSVKFRGHAFNKDVDWIEESELQRVAPELLKEFKKRLRRK